MIWPITSKHPYRPMSSLIGTQCGVPGCWGWVDDPRHITMPRLPMAYPIRASAGRKTPAAKRGPVRTRPL